MKRNSQTTLQHRRPERVALIIGAMKSGTTALYVNLKRHSQVACCTIKEPNFFASDENWNRGLEWYWSLWHWDPSQHRIAIEASTHYTKMPAFPNAAERIARIKNVEFRFVYLMRNPIERIESQALHDVYNGWGESLASGARQHAVELSMYAMQLEPYRQLFGRERLLLLYAEDLKARPAETLSNVCRFLEIDPCPTWETRRGITANTRQKRLELTPPQLERYVRPGLLRAARRFAPRWAKTKLKAMLRRRIDASCRLTPSQRDQVLTQLLPDLRRLRSTYALDFEQKWGIKV